MIDIKLIRADEEKVINQLQARYPSSSAEHMVERIIMRYLVEEIARVDRGYRLDLDSLENLRSAVNHTNERFKAEKRKPTPKEIEDMRGIKDLIKDLEEFCREGKAEIEEMMNELPNIPHHTTPGAYNEVAV